MRAAKRFVLVSVQLRGRSSELAGDGGAQIREECDADGGHDRQKNGVFSKRRTALIAAERPQARHDFHFFPHSKQHERIVCDHEDA